MYQIDAEQLLPTSLQEGGAAAATTTPPPRRPRDQRSRGSSDPLRFAMLDINVSPLYVSCDEAQAAVVLGAMAHAEKVTEMETAWVRQTASALCMPSAATDAEYVRLARAVRRARALTLHPHPNPDPNRHLNPR
jgi:hypothetical protein